MPWNDPQAPTLTFGDLPSADRAAGVNLWQKDIPGRIRARQESLRVRTCPPDPRGGSQSYPNNSATVFAALSWTGRQYFPPWSSKLYMLVWAAATVGSGLLTQAKLRLRARWGAAEPYTYTNESGVLLRSDGGHYADGICPDDSGVEYLKRCVLEIPASFLDTEQPFVWEMASGGGLSGGDLMQSPRLNWYFAV